MKVRGSRIVAACSSAWPIIPLIALLGVVAAVASAGDIVAQRRGTEVLISVVLVTGLYMFSGTSGVLSFGHISFMCVGAYVTALVTIPQILKSVLLPDLPEWLEKIHLAALPAALLAGAVAAVWGGVLSIPLARLTGVAMSLALFAVLLITNVVAVNWAAVTRGSGTMLGVPMETTIARALMAAILTVACAHLFTQSRIGLALRASREDEIGARAVGISVVWERRVALVLSAFFVGIAGFLYAQYLGSFNPNVFYLDITFMTLAMLVIGGTDSLAGAVTGAVLVSVCSIGLLELEAGFSVAGIDVPRRSGIREVGIAIVMVGILIFRPRGVTGGNEIPSLARIRLWIKDVRRPGGRSEGRLNESPPQG